MRTKGTFRIKAIEEIRRELEKLPKCQKKEVTKVEAMRMLAPQIHALRAKGYSLGAIAEVLSTNGITLTETSLRSYLWHVKTNAKRKATRARPPATENKKPAAPVVVAE